MVGAAVGLIPCWDAVLLLALAWSIGRAALGIALVIAFSVGSAATILMVGLAAGLLRQGRRPALRVRPHRPGARRARRLAAGRDRRRPPLSIRSGPMTLEATRLLPGRRTPEEADQARLARAIRQREPRRQGDARRRLRRLRRGRPPALRHRRDDRDGRRGGRRGRPRGPDRLVPAASRRRRRRSAASRLPTIEADPRGMFGNAARCGGGTGAARRLRPAVRPVGRRRGPAAPGRAILPPARSPGPVRYSGAITAETPRKERIGAWKMRLYGFDQVKVKVGVAGQDDPARLRRIRTDPGQVDGRPARRERGVAGRRADRAGRAAPVGVRPTALEQPVPHAEVGALAELRPALGMPVMLDESLCGVARRAPGRREGLADLFNVRISKCGGLFPTLRLIGAGLSSMAWASSSAATRARRACSRRPAGTWRRTWPGSATSRARTTATSWPRT